MSMRYLGGFITASYNPLKVPNAPTIGTVTAGNTQVSVAFTAPSNVGGSAITSYSVLASNGTITSGASSPIVVTGLTNGVSYTFQVLATNSYGPSAFSATSGAVTPVNALLYSWGNNASGALGQNIAYTTNVSSPTQVGALATWATISGAIGTASAADSLYQAVNTSGQLYAWGDNSPYGGLGLNDTANRSSPTQVGALTNWSKVAVGDMSSYAVKTDGTIWAWGFNNYGQLGTGNSTNISSPAQLGSLTNWANVVSGGNVTLALKTDGTLWAWGRNNNGQLGQNNRTYRSSPVQVGADTTWLKISAGYQWSLAVKTDGTLWAWGRNSQGQLGQNNEIYRSSPTQVGALTNWANVFPSTYCVTAVKTDGTMWSWGAGFFGMLGQNSTSNVSSPTQIGSLTTWLKAIGGYANMYAIKTDGTLWAWGQNDAGQLGKNNTVSYSSPVQVGTATNWNIIAASAKSAAALTS